MIILILNLRMQVTMILMASAAYAQHAIKRLHRDATLENI